MLYTERVAITTINKCQIKVSSRITLQWEKFAKLRLAKKPIIRLRSKLTRLRIAVSSRSRLPK